MMKINIIGIILDHLGTLRDAKTRRIMKSDIFAFILLPVAAGAMWHLFGPSLDKDAHNVSITFFGIFIALLLNIQVAIFAILQRKWDPPSDEKLKLVQQGKLKERLRLLSELNVNISYLILFCCLALVWFLILFVYRSCTQITSAISVTIYVHFLFTLIMIVKRSHALFQREYIDTRPE